MDIITLRHNLHEEVSCCVCMTTFTDPKQLPCLHSFGLHSLNGIQRTSGRHDIITFPECRRESRVPSSGKHEGSADELSHQQSPRSRCWPLTSVTLAMAVKCGNCDKKSSNSFFCFQCHAFWCEADCISFHNIMEANKEHRVLALKNFQDVDFENILKRPSFCRKPGHEKKNLKSFCKICEVAVHFALTEHEGHAKMVCFWKKLQMKASYK